VPPGGGGRAAGIAQFLEQLGGPVLFGGLAVEDVGAEGQDVPQRVQRPVGVLAGGLGAVVDEVDGGVKEAADCVEDAAFGQDV
jgi:hypothetical protein